MRESSTYQAILAEGEARGLTLGRVAEARAILLRQASRRFGPPDRRTRAALERIVDLERLEQLADRVLDARGWDDLLAEP